MGKKAKVVIDTNIIVSAFGWHGKPEEVVRLAVDGEIRNFITADMLDELRRVLSYPKLDFPDALQAEIIETVFTASALVSAGEPLNVIEDDPEDNRVLECALSASASFIISGDKHLLRLGRFRGIEILTAEDFLNRRGA